MAKRAMTTTERPDVLAIKAALGTSKEALRDAITLIDKLMDEAKTAGRTAEYNDCYETRAEFAGALQLLHKYHARASRRLDFAVEAGPEILGPGGGRKT